MFTYVSVCARAYYDFFVVACMYVCFSECVPVCVYTSVCVCGGGGGGCMSVDHGIIPR